MYINIYSYTPIYIYIILGSLLEALALDFLTSEGSWRHLLYFCVFSIQNLYKICFFENPHCNRQYHAHVADVSKEIPLVKNETQNSPAPGSRSRCN